ncbi:MAG: hypothetical protein KDK99_05230 [Verrucomicrobiales bacterium]|nr:hypothetical protein [Verrucomicrobiales bacterium]
MHRLIATLLTLLVTTSFAAPEVRPLPEIRTLGIGPCMDAAVSGDSLVVIGSGKLHTFDLTDPTQPRHLGSLDGLGNTRQIVVRDDIAYISSREYGVYLVSIADRAHPQLLNHYDSIELATGLALAGDVLFVACRQYGVEFVDVSDPRQPRHLSTVLTGEAQSVTYHDGYLYAGVWASSEIVTVDARDARAPKIVSKTPLDGYGDGVEVRDGILYAATGHHSRLPHAEEEEPGYGTGHGLEMFDLTDPANPQFLGRIKFPPFYTIGNDMWSVSVINGHAFVADTHNGIFVVDVRDPRHPALVASHQLPSPPRRDIPGYYGGIAVGQGCIYGAGGWTDLHVLEEPHWAQPVISDTGSPPHIGPEQPFTDPHVAAAYHPPGQVHGVTMIAGDTLAAAACGSAGVHLLRLGDSSIEPVSIIPTEDFATDVYARDHTLYVCEGVGGLSIWKIQADGKATRQGSYTAPNARVRYVVVPEPGNLALIEVNAGELHIVDVTDPAAPRRLLKESWLGLFYGDQLLDAIVDGRYAAAFWHASGLHWYDLTTQPPQHEGVHPEGRFGIFDGLLLHEERLLAIRRGGWVWFDRNEARPFDELPVQRVPDLYLSGRPTLSNHVLYLTHRAYSQVTILDVRDWSAPTKLDQYSINGNPGTLVPTPHGPLLPAGYSGLLLLKMASPGGSKQAAP